MLIRSAFVILSFVLSVVVGAIGITSAVQRAPDRDSLALESFQRGLGITVADLCGNEAMDEHSCPLCHGLPHAPQANFSAISYLFTPHQAWPQLRRLQRAAQARNINHSPRAPPVLA